jgi:hypothetical protein
MFGSNVSNMTDRTHLSTWISRETKARFSAAARAQGLSESAWLKRLVEAALGTGQGPISADNEPGKRVAALERLSIRIRGEDLLLLRERAKGRELPPSTYVSLLIRAHLRKLSPLPTAEIAAVKRSIAELNAIGRNLNQFARGIHSGESVAGPTRSELHALLRACTELRDHIKALLIQNLASWQAGHEETDHRPS